MIDVLDVYKAAESQVEENFQKNVKAWKEALADKDVTEVTKTGDERLPFILVIKEKGDDKAIGGLHIYKDGRSVLVKSVFASELKEDMELLKSIAALSVFERAVLSVSDDLLIEYPACKFYMRRPGKLELVAQALYALPFDAHQCSVDYLSADFDRAVEAIETCGAKFREALN